MKPTNETEESEKPKNATWYQISFTEEFEENSDDKKVHPSAKSWVWPFQAYTLCMFHTVLPNVGTVIKLGKSDIYEKCFIRKVAGSVVGGERWDPIEEPLQKKFPNLTRLPDPKALVGLVQPNQSELKAKYDGIESDKKLLYERMRIYACDQQPKDFDGDSGRFVYI